MGNVDEEDEWTMGRFNQKKVCLEMQHGNLWFFKPIYINVGLKSEVRCTAWPDNIITKIYGF